MKRNNPSGEKAYHWKGGPKHAKCLKCAKDFTFQPSASKGKYCSYECYWGDHKIHSGENSNSWKGGPVTKNCLKCGKEFTCKMSQKSVLHCSMSCATKGRVSKLRGIKRPDFSGPNNPCWKGGITKLNHKLRTNAEYINWRKIVLCRDNNECQICGGTERGMVVNHIKRFVDFPELRVNVDNGITVCRNCNFKLVNTHEQEWESYFNFNLETRKLVNQYDKGVLWQ